MQSDRTAARTNTNLPQRGTFIGRASELKTLSEAFAHGTRLMSIVGSGGMGKTELALRFGNEALPRFGGGIWFCDLSAARDLDDLLTSLTRSLQIEVQFGATREQTVAELGRRLDTGRKRLVILDNFEQILSSSVATIGTWHDLGTKTSFLITSREQLHLPDEQTLFLQPMELPEESEQDARRILATESVSLFMSYVRANAPHAAFEGSDLLRLAQLVRALDGIPLALQLCAQRATVLSMSQLLEMLSQRLDLLSNRQRGHSGRHATLRATIDWSWNLLTEREQIALSACSVFRGGWELSAAASLLQLEPNAPTPALDILQALHEKSLLTVTPARDGSPLRYGMLESVRAYAAEKLEISGKRRQTEERHSMHFASKCLELIRMRYPSHSVEQRRFFACEIENLEDVCRRTLAEDSLTTDQACMVAAVLVGIDVATSGRPTNDYVKSLEQVLARWPADAKPEALLARTTIALGDAMHIRGLAECVDVFQRGLALSKQARSRSLTLLALLKLSVVTNLVGKPAEREDYLLQAKVLVVAETDPWIRGFFEGISAELAYMNGDMVHALAAFGRAIDITATLDDGRLATRARLGRSRVLLELDRAEEAVIDARAVVDSREQLQDERIIAIALGFLARAEMGCGSFADAKSHFQQAIAADQQLMNRTFEGVNIAYLADLHLEQEEFERAADLYAHAIAIFREVDNKVLLSIRLASAAVVELTLGHVESGRAKFDEAWGFADMTPLRRPLAAVALHRGHLELSRAREAQNLRAIRTRDEHLRQVRALLRAKDWENDVKAFSDVRFAKRMLTRALHRFEDETAGTARPPSSFPPPPVETMVVGADASWFKIGDSPSVSLQRRKSLRRILERLLQQRVSHPDIGVELMELFNAGWPNDRAAALAAINRVHVALSTLRKMGLQSRLQRADEGFRIDPAAPIEQVEQAQA